jgi:hypothetical protein
VCSSQFRDIIKTLEILLFKSFFPHWLAPHPEYKKLAREGVGGNDFRLGPLALFLVAYMEPKIVLGIFWWEILQAAPTVSIIAASGNGFLARVATSDQHY